MNSFTGKLKVKGETKQITDSFKKREFVITDEDSSSYPQFVLFQLVQDKCSLLDSFNVGDTLDVTFNLRGREWTSPQGEVKYFNSLDAWKIESKAQAENTAPVAAPVSGNEAPLPAATDAPPLKEEDDDLPF